MYVCREVGVMLVVGVVVGFGRRAFVLLLSLSTSTYMCGCDMFLFRFGRVSGGIDSVEFG